MREITGPLGPARAVCFQREAGTTKASLRPLSQHISHLSFDSFWVVLIISCSEMFAETLAERQEETMPSDKRTCHCALGTSKLSRYLIFFIISSFFPQKYEQCISHCSVGKYISYSLEPELPTNDKKLE